MKSTVITMSGSTCPHVTPTAAPMDVTPHGLSSRSAIGPLALTDMGMNEISVHTSARIVHSSSMFMYV